MSSQESVPLRITPARSRILAAWIVAVHGVALAALFVTPFMPWPLRAVAAVVVVAAGIHALRLHALRTAAAAIVEVTVCDETWRVVLRDGRELQAEKIGAFVHPLLVIVRLQEATAGARRWPRALVLGADAVTHDAHRRLRVAVAG